MSQSEFDSSCKHKEMYRFWFKDQVRFNDLDALGHVGSVRMNEYFAGARTRLFTEAIQGWPKSNLLPVLRMSAVLYEGEINFPADLQIGLVIEKFGNTSVVILMAVFNGDKCMALARNVFIFIDRETRKPTVPEDRVKAHFLKYA